MTFVKNIKLRWYLVVTLVVACAIILYRFPYIPQNLSEDELDFARLAFHLGTQSFAPYTTLATGHTTLYYYILLYSMKLFGVNAFGLRFPIALVSILNAGMIFLLFENVLRSYIEKKNVWMIRVVALFSTLLVVCSHWYINFARFAFEAPLLMFFELVSLYAFCLVRETRKPVWAIISGMGAGLAFNSYLPGRIFFLVPLIMMLVGVVIRVIKGRSVKGRTLSGVEGRTLNKIEGRTLSGVEGESLTKKETNAILFFFFISFLIIALPLIVYFVQNSKNPDVRVNQLSYVNNNSLSLEEKFSFTGQNVVTITNMFFVRGDGNGRHNFPFKPALNPIMGFLFVGGLLIAVKDFKRSRFHQLFLLFLFFSLLPAQMTYPWENPNMLRTFTSLLPIGYFSGVAMVHAIKNVNKLFKKIPTAVVVVGVTIVVVTSIGYELRTYFFFQRITFKEAFTMFEPLDVYIKRSIKYHSDPEFNLDFKKIFPHEDASVLDSI
ncbi:glycosyltransferase family 39 protein [Candidatus Woesebacteria bacterium]|nr:glycosyltransferase family 39 protein [Candidatus Woesebacteria bacterium]